MGGQSLDEQLNPSRDEISVQTLAAIFFLRVPLNQLDFGGRLVQPIDRPCRIRLAKTEEAFRSMMRILPRYSILPSDAQTLSYVENATNSGTHVWNEVRVLTKEEISLLAHCLVEQIKLRGPFLSYADFVNRRVQAKRENVLGKHMTEWGWPMDGSSGEVRENRETMLNAGAVRLPQRRKLTGVVLINIRPSIELSGRESAV